MNETQQFHIGQVFDDGVYPPEAACWCDANGTTIAKRREGGVQIVKVVREESVNQKESHMARLKTLMQNRLDAWARENSFDSIHAAASYAGVVDEDADPLAQKFVQDGNHAKAQMIKTWAAGLAMLNLYQAGQLDELTDEQFIAELPELSWEY